MTATKELERAPEVGAPDVATGDRLRVDRPKGRPLLRYLGMPAFLVLVCVALYAYVQGQELDSIEARILAPDFVRRAFAEHLYLVAVSTVLVVLTAVPLGIVLTRPWAERVGSAFVAVSGVGQAIPSLGVIALFALLFGIGPRYAIGALVIYAFLPVLRNTMVGLRQVDASVIEAGRGTGMSSARVLSRIELPLAVPVVLAGIRTALVINVGTATIAVLTNAGGLGGIIFDGIVQARQVVLVTGSVLAAVLALGLDHLAGIAEDVLRPRGL